MKKIKTSDIVENVRRQPFSKASLDHLQEAFQEVFFDLVKGITNEENNVVVLHGCIDSDADANDYDISAGAVIYNGEVFRVPAFVGSHVTNVPVLSLVTSYRAGDPVTFTDNNDFDVHEIRTMVWTMATAGSGLANFSGLRRLSDRVRLKSKIVEIGDWNMDTTASINVNHGLNPNLIRSVSVIIKSDAGNLYPIDGADANGVMGFIQSIGAVSISLARDASPGTFDSAAFDDTPFNRGWITILYES